jgi:hypothetical protein
MADNINALVNTDEENGTQSAAWTDVNNIAPDQKVLIGRVDSLSGNMVASWEPSSDAAVLVEKTITANGEYDATLDEADGYSAVTVNVPNTYEAEDEGKVVSSGALVAQTARSESITANNTYDTTENNSVTVAVAATLSASDLVDSITANGSFALWYYTVSPSVVHFTAAADVPSEGVTTLGTVTVAVE